MAIAVVCTACKARFQVSEKFAGKQGPCPKCKAVITVPKLEDQVVIHAPEEFSGGAATAAKDAQGRSVLKPLSRQKTRLTPLSIALMAGGAITVLAVAFALGRAELANGWILGAGAVLMAPPLVLGGYAILREAELEPYRGVPLYIRTAIVSAVYALLWGGYVLIASRVWGYPEGSAEMFQVIPAAAVLITIGSLVALGTLDLEATNAFFHCMLYVVVTALLLVVMGIRPF